MTIVHWSRNKLRSIVLTIVRSERIWGRTRQKLEVHVASIIDLADIIGCAAHRLLPFELASKLLVAVIRRFHVRLFDKRLASSTNELVLDFNFLPKIFQHKGSYLLLKNCFRAPPACILCRQPLPIAFAYASASAGNLCL